MNATVCSWISPHGMKIHQLDEARAKPQLLIRHHTCQGVHLSPWGRKVTLLQIASCIQFLAFCCVCRFTSCFSQKSLVILPYQRRFLDVVLSLSLPLSCSLSLSLSTSLVFSLPVSLSGFFVSVFYAVGQSPWVASQYPSSMKWTPSFTISLKRAVGFWTCFTAENLCPEIDEVHLFVSTIYSVIGVGCGCPFRNRLQKTFINLQGCKKGNQYQRYLARPCSCKERREKTSVAARRKQNQEKDSKTKEKRKTKRPFCANCGRRRINRQEYPIAVWLTRKKLIVYPHVSTGVMNCAVSQKAEPKKKGKKRTTATRGVEKKLHQQPQWQKPVGLWHRTCKSWHQTVLPHVTWSCPVKCNAELQFVTSWFQVLACLGTNYQPPWLSGGTVHCGSCTWVVCTKGRSALRCKKHTSALWLLW